MNNVIGLKSLHQRSIEDVLAEVSASAADVDKIVVLVVTKDGDFNVCAGGGVSDWDLLAFAGLAQSFASEALGPSEGGPV